MRISYDKFIMLKAKYKLTGEEIRKATGITTSEMAKINKEPPEYVTLITLQKLRKYMSEVVGRELRMEHLITFIDE